MGSLEISRTPGSEDEEPKEEEEDDPGIFLPTKSTMNIGSASKLVSSSASTPPRDSRRSSSPSQRQGQSPKIPQASVTQMTQQLSNLMGLGNEAGAPLSGTTRSRSASIERKHLNKTPDMIQLQTPSPYLANAVSVSRFFINLGS